MNYSPFTRFTAEDVREILRGAGLPDSLDDDNIAQVGLTSLRTQRERVLALYRIDPDVDAIHTALSGQVEKSSIRSYLSRASSTGEIGDEWRQRRRRNARRQHV